MKLNKLIFLLLLAISFMACKKDLEILPEQSLADEIVFTSKAGAQSALNGVYSSAQSINVFGSQPTDHGRFPGR